MSPFPYPDSFLDAGVGTAGDPHEFHAVLTLTKTWLCFYKGDKTA
jgi:hypothetical protein